MITIREVAQDCGLSMATVSNVLSDSSRPVHPRTRERVLESARRLKYHPNAMARSLTGRRVETIGVLFGVVEPEVITNPYASLILQGVLTTASRYGYNVTLWTKHWKDESDSAIMFTDRRTDGFVLVAPPLDSKIVPALADLNLPLVVVSSQTVPSGIPWVDVDNRAGLRLATEHVISLGHTKIAHMSGDPTQPSVADRRRGYLDAMKAAGLPVPPEYLVTSWYIVDESMKDTRRLLSLPDPPTAIVTGSDNIAYGILKVAREMGLRVPDDLSVTGFDDLPATSLVEPPMTTVRQPLVQIGEYAAKQLLQQIESDGGGESFLADPELIVRSSTGPPGR